VIEQVGRSRKIGIIYK